MTRRKPIDSTRGLVQTRRSMGDGTVKGRSRIATPYDPRRLRRPGSIVQPRRGGPDPRTITVEATDVEVPPDDWHTIEWQAATGGRTLYRFPEPDYPAASLEVPSTGVWRARMDLRWDDGEFESVDDLAVEDGAWTGGGSVRLTGDGPVPLWPGTLDWTEPVGVGLHRRFVDVTGGLLLVRRQPVRLEVRHDSDEPRTLAWAVLSLSQLEPLRRSAGLSYDLDQIGGTEACPGPRVWTRMHGEDSDLDDPTNIDPDDCRIPLSGSAPETVEGPFGDAAHVPSGEVGQYMSSSDGTLGFQTMFVWIMLTGPGSGVIVHADPGAGSAYIESSPPQIRKAGEDGVQFRVGRGGATHEGSPFGVTVTGLPTNEWIMVGQRWTADTRMLDGWVNGERVVSEWVDPDEHSVGSDGRPRLLRSRNAFGEVSQEVTNLALAECLIWPEVLTDAEVGQVFSQAANL